MRVRQTMFVAGLAILVLVVHLAVPMAWFEVRDGRSAVVESGTLSRFEMADRLGADGAGDVPGAGMGYLLGSAVAVAVGGMAYMAAAWVPQAWRAWARLGSGSLLGLGTAMTLHGNGLWAGRATSTLLHNAFYEPARAQEHEAVDAVASGDAFTSIVPISPLVICALGLLLLFFLARSWSLHVREDRHLRLSAWRHGRLALIGAAVLLAAMSLPWVVQELHEDITPAEGTTAGTDHFFWSAYDILQKREASQVLAEESGEAGLQMWPGLAIALRFLMVGLVLAIVGPLVALGGKDVEGAGSGVFGRLLENASLIALVGHGYAVVAALLGAFFLLHPLEFEEAVTTGLPLLLAIPAGIGIGAAGLLARDVVAVDTDLVADDFPEPVMYD